MSQQLELFPAPATGTSALIVPFPLARRRKLVVRTAATLVGRKTQDGRDGYWSRTIAGLAAELHRHGADRTEIDRQLSHFHRAVGDQIARDNQRNQPPGAA